MANNKSKNISSIPNVNKDNKRRRATIGGDKAPQADSKPANDSKPAIVGGRRRVSSGETDEIYSCEVCKERLVSSKFLTHVADSHPDMDPLGVRVLRGSDQKYLNIREFLGRVFKCGVQDCKFVRADRNKSGTHLAETIHEHYKSCHVGLSTNVKPVNSLGYLCNLAHCWKILRNKGEVLGHVKSAHPATDGLSIPYRNLDEHKDLYLSSMFKHVEQCQTCGQIFAHDQDQNKVDEDLRQHVEDSHQGEGEQALAPALPTVQSVIGYQCMAGFGGDSSICNCVLPKGNIGNTLEHWQYRHKKQQLRELMFMDTETKKFFQISDIFDSVLRCPVPRCMKVVYTNQKIIDQGSNAALKQLFLEHVSSTHAGDTKHPSFKMLKTSKFLSQQNLDGIQEDILEQLPTAASELPVMEGKGRGLISPKGSRVETVSVETRVEDINIRGYTCGIKGCDKSVLISFMQGTTVAINRLKTHFKNKHESLADDQFSFITIYKQKSEGKIPVKEEQSRVPVYQCPNRSCQEVSVHFRELEEHWDTLHREDPEAVFKPTIVASTDGLIHCSVQAFIQIIHTNM